MKLLLVFIGLVGLGSGTPQRFLPRQGRQQSYLAPASSNLDNSYLAPAPSDVDNSYLAPVAAASDVDNSYLAPAAAASDSYGAASEDYDVPAADAFGAASDVDYAAPSDSYGAASEDVADELDSYGAASEDEVAAAPADNYGAASEEDAAAAPADNYGVAAEEAASDIVYDEYDASDIPADQAAYAGAPLAPAAAPAPAASAQPSYDELDAAASGEDMGLKMLMNAVPGTPGEDYPIYAEAPETAFTCDGQVDGGYYADSEAECQVFHICTANGLGGLAKYSFLCPNGTIFNQNYFICDWWFNFDCSEAAAIASEKNSELAAAREEASASASEAIADASESEGSYAAPADTVEAAPSDAVNSLYGAPELEAAESTDDLSGYEQSSYNQRL